MRQAIDICFCGCLIKQAGKELDRSGESCFTSDTTRGLFQNELQLECQVVRGDGDNLVELSHISQTGLISICLTTTMVSTTLAV